MPLTSPLGAEKYVFGFNRPSASQVGYGVSVTVEAATGLVKLAYYPLSGMTANAPALAPIGWQYWSLDDEELLIKTADGWESAP